VEPAGAALPVCSALAIVNRARFPRWWGKDIESVCRALWQFSCWNAGDPNLPKLLAVNETDTEFRLALEIAHKAAAGALPDLTQGADSYTRFR
jgi:N-acetylmuramoyl-L-alanine amidase